MQTTATTDTTTYSTSCYIDDGRQAKVLACFIKSYDQIVQQSPTLGLLSLSDYLSSVLKPELKNILVNCL